MSTLKFPSSEAAADRLLSDSGQTGPPVSFDRLLQSLPGVKMSLEELDGPGYLLDLGRQGAEILLNSKEPVPRKRFTAAHELGHWVLRQQGFPLTADANEILRVAIEKWCGEFAAALLMPRQWILRDANASGPLGVPRLFLHVPGKYLVSDEACKLRIGDIVPISLGELLLKRGIFRLDRLFQSRFFSPQMIEGVMSRSAHLLQKQKRAGHYVDSNTHLDVVFEANDLPALVFVFDTDELRKQFDLSGPAADRQP